jgi:hypothetical protein
MISSETKDGHFISWTDSADLRRETGLLAAVVALTVAILLTPPLWLGVALASLVGLVVLCYLVLSAIRGTAQMVVTGWVLLFPLSAYFLSFPREKPIITLDRFAIGLILLATAFKEARAGAQLDASLRRLGFLWGCFVAVGFLSLVNIGSAKDVLGSARIIVDAFVLPAILGWYVIVYFDLSSRLASIHAICCIVAAYLAGIGIAEVISGQDLLPVPGAGLFFAGDTSLFLRVNGPFSSNNTYSLVGLLALWFIAFLRWAIGKQNMNRWQRVLHILGLTCAFVTAVLPLFRSVFLTIGLIFLIEAWTERRSWRGVLRLSVLVAIAAVFLAANTLMPDLYEERVSSGDNIFARFAQQRQNLRVFLDHPVLGVGMGNFAQAVPKLTLYSGAFSGVDPLDSPHNTLAAILAETGVLGGIPFVGANVLLVLAFWRVKKRSAEVGKVIWKYFSFFYLSYWISGLSLTSGYAWSLNMWFVFVVACLYRYGATLARTQEMRLSAEL